jgi:sugar phosphate isomerase/epimerase
VSGFRGPIADVQDDVADPFRRAADSADGSGIQLCVSNSAAGLIRTGAELSTLLDAVGNSAVTAAWNPMEAAMAGEDPSEGVDALEGRIGLVRCSNGSRSGNGWEARTIDSGAVDWADQIQRLRRMGFAGPISLEIRAEPRAVNGLREATALIRMLRAN